MTETNKSYGQYQDQASDRETLLRHAFDGSNDGICIVSLDGRFLKVNQKMVEIYGYSAEDLEKMNVNDIAHPDDRKISPEFIRKSISGSITSDVFEKRYFHKNGHLLYGQVSTSLIRDNEGEPVYFISHVQDVTERKRIEAERELLIAELKSLNDELTSNQKELERLACKDHLTNLYNRRHFAEMSETSFELARRNKSHLSIILMDADNFKNINDVHGHDIGDKALVKFAEVLQSQIRKSDVLCRWGGEEFIILLHEASSADAAKVAEKIRSNLEKSLLNIDDHTCIQLKASFGVATYDLSTSQKLSDIITKADKALLRAKESGKNQVVVDQ